MDGVVLDVGYDHGVLLITRLRLGLIEADEFLLLGWRLVLGVIVLSPIYPMHIEIRLKSEGPFVLVGMFPASQKLV